MVLLVSMQEVANVKTNARKLLGLKRQEAGGH